MNSIQKQTFRKAFNALLASGQSSGYSVSTAMNMAKKIKEKCKQEGFIYWGNDPSYNEGNDDTFFKSKCKSFKHKLIDEKIILGFNIPLYGYRYFGNYRFRIKRYIGLHSNVILDSQTRKIHDDFKPSNDHVVDHIYYSDHDFNIIERLGIQAIYNYFDDDAPIYPTNLVYFDGYHYNKYLDLNLRSARIFMREKEPPLLMIILKARQHIITRNS